MGKYSGHTGDILNIVVSHDGTLAVTLGADETLQIWQMSDGKAHTPIYHKKIMRFPSEPLLR
jgi:WD40 repeat protein